MTIQWETTPEQLSRAPKMIDIYGGTFSGRTTLACTARRPLVVLHAGENVPDVVDKLMLDDAGKVIMAKGRDGINRPSINVFCYAKSELQGELEKEIIESARVEIDLFREALKDCLPWASTIIIDTGTDLWLGYRLMYFGKEKPDNEAKKTQREHYTAVNGEWRRLIATLKTAGGPDVIFVHKERYKYVNDKPTDILTTSGQPDMEYIVQLQFHTQRIVRDVGEERHVIFITTMKKTGINAQVCEDVVPNATLPLLLSRIYGLPEEHFK